ncbi:protein REPRESSOR OF SILENCING 3 isoform X2 [Cornus florida]|uniref:protein REPRESSOR OF SILENCING 3 isoform X2 n=1 Tax=Cornus florida TaxID=4283 RepID=UPI00289DF0F5|nr:protein REPRESSOR OF SILENCING 3 isoform X2 [Cornus florida]
MDLLEYNGCLWKGGRLRLEKAKEHYLLRLKKEWAEDAELPESTPSNGVDAAKNMESLENPKKVLKSEKMPLRLFFPKLKKMKSLPFSGTGKHKYSFQRIEVPSLPIHFCDCEEHSGHSYTTKVEHFHDPETQRGGINEEELKIMKSVMSKIFERENISESTRLEAGSANQEKNSTESIDDLIMKESEADDEADEDNLIMNMVAGGNNRVAFFGSQGNETISANEESVLQTSKYRPPQNMLKSQKRNILTSNKKRSAHAEESDKSEFVSATRKRKSEILLDSEIVEPDPQSATPERKSEILLDSEIVEPYPRTKRSKTNVSWSQKTAWRNLIGERGNSPFLVSQIMQTTATDEEQPKSDGSSVPDLAESKRQNLEKHGNMEMQQLDESRPAKPNEVVNKSSKSKSDGSSVPDLAESKNQNLEKHGNREMQKLDESLSAKPNEIFNKSSKSKSDGSSVPDLAESKNQNLEKHGNMGMQKLDESWPAKPKEVVSKSSRGASWLQKSSWTQLVGETNRGSFSISQILPGSFERQEILEPNGIYTTNSSDSKHSNLFKPTGSEFPGDGPRILGITNENVPNSSNMVALAENRNDTDLNVEQSTPENNVQTVKENNEVSAPTLGKEQHSARKQTSVKDWEIGETCPFMKSDASMREWVKTKVALSASLQKKGSEKKAA